MESLRAFVDAGSPFFFVTLEQDAAEDFIRRECQSIGISQISVRKLPKLTDGQATSALRVGDMIEAKDQPVAIYNIDTYVDPQYLTPSLTRGAGWIPCFPGEGDKWSFVRAKEDGTVCEVREKRRISPHATVGFYWFDSFDRYSSAYESYYSDPANVERGERYIAPLYNQLIDHRHEVYFSAIPAEAVHALGTPEDVEVFRARQFQTCCSDSNV
jgi:hypothetical protein